MIQTGIDDKHTKQPTMSLADLFKNNEEVRKTYEKARFGKYVKMEEVIERPIAIHGYTIAMEQSSYTGEDQEFMRIQFTFCDEDDNEEHECRTQSRKLMDTLRAVGNERIEEAGGFYTMICQRKEGAKTFLWFDGVE